jgi:hypothetical protein
MVKFKQVRHLSVAIERAPQDVYAYAGQPENMPAWAAGLGNGISRAGADWEVHTAHGTLKMRFAPPNDHGVLDHTVVLPDGAEVYVPLRVLANGAGSEVVLTLYRQPEMDDAAFARDAGLVESDLARLKDLLEK